MLYQTRLKSARDVISKQDAASFERLQGLVADAPTRLSIGIDGNHCFFLGEQDARATAEAIARLEAEAGVLMQDLDAILLPPTLQDDEQSAEKTRRTPVDSPGRIWQRAQVLPESGTYLATLGYQRGQP